MTTQNTPATWEDIPKGAVVTATWGDQTIKGNLESITGKHRDKRMELRAAPFGIIKLDVRDGWEVTYETRTLEDELDLARVGDLFSNREGSVELIKLSDEYVSSRQLSGGHWEIPRIRRIKDYSHIPEGVYGLRPRL